MKPFKQRRDAALRVIQEIRDSRFPGYQLLLFLEGERLTAVHVAARMTGFYDLAKPVGLRSVLDVLATAESLLFDACAVDWENDNDA